MRAAALEDGANCFQLILGRASCLFRALFDEEVIAADGPAIVVGSHTISGPIGFARHRDGRILALIGISDTTQPYAPAPTAILQQDAYAAGGFICLTAISLEIFNSGVVASDNLDGGNFEPAGLGWEPVPSTATVDPRTTELVLVLERRFARLASQVAAERALLAVELERIAKQVEEDAREEARLSADMQAEGAKLLRQRETWRARKGLYDAWLTSLPENLKPGTHVQDLREQMPRIGEVVYRGVRLIGPECTYDVAPGNLPTVGSIRFSKTPHFQHADTDYQWQTIRNWERHEFSIIDAQETLERYVPFVGSSPQVGVRVDRPQTDLGDKYLNKTGLLELAVDLIGAEYNSQTDEAFTIRDALNFLSRRAPVRTISVPNDLHESHSEAAERLQAIRISASLEERYPEYFDQEGICNDLDACFVHGDWSSADRRLLTNENEARIAHNASWKIRRASLCRFLLALRARIGAELSSFGPEGVFAEIAIAELDMDELITFLRGAQCEVLVFGDSREPTDAERDCHAVPPGRLKDVLARWSECSGSAALFRFTTNDLVDMEEKFEFVVEGLIPAGQVGLLVGPAKLGKSTLAFDLALRVASGRAFAGIPVRRGKAVYLYGEDSTSVMNARIRTAGDEAIAAGRDFLAIPAHEFGSSIDKALSEISVLPNLSLLVVDTSAVFVPDTNSGGAARQLMGALASFADRTGCAVLVIHHTGKDLTAGRAKSAKGVFDKAKGSGEFVNAARFVLTLHLESALKDERAALQHGLRLLSLQADNIPAGVPKVQQPLVFKLDPATGLSQGALRTSVSAPVVQGDGAMPVQVDELLEDVLAASPIIEELERQLGRRLPYAGAKSLYRLKGKGQLEGWSRARCERAHKAIGSRISDGTRIVQLSSTI